MKRIVFILVLSLFSLHTASAKQAAPLADDPALEERVNDVTHELRCLVCQNQTIADSHADLAIDLKNQVRTMLSEGKNKKDVIDYMVARYGDFVLYRPPMKSTTVLLWFGPAILLLVGGIVLFVSLRKRSQRLAASPLSLSEEEEKRVESLLETADEGKQS